MLCSDLFGGLRENSWEYLSFCGWYVCSVFSMKYLMISKAPVNDRHLILVCDLSKSMLMNDVYATIK